jgi:hypothetical protein
MRDGVINAHTLQDWAADNEVALFFFCGFLVVGLTLAIVGPLVYRG